MKKILILIFIIGIIFSCKKNNNENKEKNLDKNSKQVNINEARWISSKSGLRMRDSAGINGNKIGVIPYGEEITLLEEKENIEEISGAKGKWSRVLWKDKEGWVFGGFLSEDEIIIFSNKFLWKGKRKDNPIYYSIYYPDNGWEINIHIGYFSTSLALSNKDTIIAIPTKGVGLGECEEIVTNINIGKSKRFPVRKRDIYFPNGKFFMVLYENYPEGFRMCMENLNGNFSANDITVFEQMADTVEVVTESEYKKYLDSLDSNNTE